MARKTQSTEWKKTSKQILDAVKCLKANAATISEGRNIDRIAHLKERCADSHYNAVSSIAPAVVEKKRRLQFSKKSSVPKMPKTVISDSSASSSSTTSSFSTVSSSSSSKDKEISPVSKRNCTRISMSMASQQHLKAKKPKVILDQTERARFYSALNFFSPKSAAGKKSSNANSAVEAARTIQLKTFSPASDTQSEKVEGTAVTEPQQKFLVYTNMSKKQIKVIHETVKKLGDFTLEPSVSNLTTHVVSLKPQRTVNMMFALVRGLWILQYTWIVDSLALGHWRYEQPYEMTEFSSAVKICRAECQAFGKSYKCELFSSLGPIYISTSIRWTHISRDNLKDLIELCGGRVVKNRNIANYIVGKSCGDMDAHIYVTPLWILGSITQMQLLKIPKYSVPSYTSQTVLTAPEAPKPALKV